MFQQFCAPFDWFVYRLRFIFDSVLVWGFSGAYYIIFLWSCWQNFAYSKRSTKMKFLMHWKVSTSTIRKQWPRLCKSVQWFESFLSPARQNSYSQHETWESRSDFHNSGKTLLFKTVYRMHSSSLCFSIWFFYLFGQHESGWPSSFRWFSHLLSYEQDNLVSTGVLVLHFESRLLLMVLLSFASMW